MSSASSSKLRSLAVRLARSQPTRYSTEGGLTLIECLVAMVIITVTVVAITPPILLATATRVQSRRAEQATAVAQGEIDRVRLLVERSDKDVTYKQGVDLPAPYSGLIKDAPVATAISSDRIVSSAVDSANPTQACGVKLYPAATPLPGTDLVPVDVDGDCKPEFVMQVFRAENQYPLGTDPSKSDSAPYAFKVGVRVYSYFSGETLPTLDTVRSSSVSTTGARDNSVGGGKRKPLAVLYTTIARSGSSSTLCQVRQQINSADTCTTPSPSPSP